MEHVQVPPLALGTGLLYHFAICHHLLLSEGDDPSSGANQLRQQLRAAGCSVVVLRPDASADEISRCVAASQCLLLYLGGRQSESLSSEYQGLFGNRCCHEQLRIAQEAEKVIIGVKETNAAAGLPDFNAEKRCCVSGSREAAQCAWALRQVCFIERRTAVHEIPAFISEVLRQGLCG
jgi:hypothetical protein